MARREKAELLIPASSLEVLKTAVIFERWPEDEIYYRCPRCQQLLEREFIGYCSSCGQCLDWREYRKARRVYNRPQ